MFEHVAIARECALASTSAIQPFVDAPGQREPEPEAEHHRNEPERGLDDAGREESQKNPDAAGQNEHRGLQDWLPSGEERWALGPFQEAIDLLVTCLRQKEAVGSQVFAPSIEWRKRFDSFLPLSDRFGGSRREKPFREPARAHCRRRRAQPLKKRRASKEVQIAGVRMPLERTPGKTLRRVASGQLAPVSTDPGNCVVVDEAQRVEPRDAILDSRVPDDEHRENREENRRGNEEWPHWAARQGPDRGGCAGKKSQKTKARENARSAGLRQPLGSIAPHGVFVTQRRPGACRGRRREGHAACSAASGFRAAIFNLQ